ncbi:beta-1,6-glucanase [Domibacillus indicus]|uniref:glycoside hydrolase family 30 protein n=1 Tax=Domibacillus indicus TaxID=1437523 RepID=UPI0020401347|nr:glycoside hydrolase family 30 beta sandwich domain-containing protein [Domibacillus indicus]MCM3790665.1 beta-1,6-glucanase [Domibacillus indicus]
MNQYQRRALFILLIGVLLVVLFVQWGSTEENHQKEETGATVSAWLTTGDQTSLLTKQPPLSFSAAEKSNERLIEINRRKTYQTIDGFGAALTGSSAYLINQKLDQEAREALLEDLFTNKGINLTHIRHTIGSSDFSVDEQGNPSTYTYDDTNGEQDFSLNHFSIEKDGDVTTVLRSILDKQHPLTIMGTPWTAPPWMKYGERTHNGWYLDYTNENIYQAYAEYFVRYIQAYAQIGISIDSITVQNEPGHTSPDYPTMSMGAEEQAAFIGEYLGPAFEANGIDTNIIAYDHNWKDALAYTSSLFSNEKANRYTDGAAFHCYEGSPDAMNEVHARFPNKNLHVSECSGGEWSQDFGENLGWQMSHLMIESPRNWAKSVLMWNVALDENSGPANGGCQECRGVVTINQQTGEVTKNVEYYVLGHASKFVQTGAVRIGSDTYEGAIETVAYQNPDSSTVLIASNPSKEKQQFQVRDGEKSFTYTLPSQSAVTFTWNKKNSSQ